MIPNLGQLLLVCGIVTLIVFAVVYVMVNIMKDECAKDLEESSKHD